MADKQDLDVSADAGNRAVAEARRAGQAAEHPRHSEIVVASYNVHKCVGIDRRFDPGRIMEVISEIGADVIALQEADQRFGDRAGLLDLHAIERETGLVPVQLAGRSKSHGWHGNVVLFRKGTVTSARQLVLPGAEPRGAVIVDLDLEAGPMRLIAAHFGLLKHSRKLQAGTLLSAAELHSDKPTVLVGDLNEWRLGKRSSLRSLTPAFGPAHALVPSFPSRFPVLALDRVMVRPPSLLTDIEAHDTELARVASDHLPIKAIIRLRSSLNGADAGRSAAA
ncbi:endonuclease/exonuclease/phosphatase family protein [Aminobacter sp. HY435]|uniref:endonuclease/exonuclease/phosphatase family protein n=1 Tax=Aminobacter sp. HY435 TaxID=2970917 RepID=UPI0022B99DB5|nr:endonuclease/exonuclease/phosphatase family protein [Aminobacter sp. HY435]